MGAAGVKLSPHVLQYYLGYLRTSVIQERQLTPRVEADRHRNLNPKPPGQVDIMTKPRIWAIPYYYRIKMGTLKKIQKNDRYLPGTLTKERSSRIDSAEVLRTPIFS